MSVKLRHEGLAEAHDLSVTLSLGVKIRAALSASHGKRRKTVLKGLFKAQKLKYGQVYGRMKAKPALVGSYRAVKLNSVSAVYMYLPSIILPWNSEHDYPLRLCHSLKQSLFFVLGMSVDYRLK